MELQIFFYQFIQKGITATNGKDVVVRHLFVHGRP